MPATFSTPQIPSTTAESLRSVPTGSPPPFMQDLRLMRVPPELRPDAVERKAQRLPEPPTRLPDPSSLPHCLENGLTGTLQADSNTMAEQHHLFSASKMTCPYMRSLMSKPQAFRWLHEDIAMPLLRRGIDLDKAVEYFVLANDLHAQQYGLPSPTALYNVACCFSLAAEKCIAQVLGETPMTTAPSSPGCSIVTSPPDSSVSTPRSTPFVGTPPLSGSLSLSRTVLGGFTPPPPSTSLLSNSMLFPPEPGSTRNTNNATILEARLNLAVEWLFAAVGAGYVSVDEMRKDPDLRAVRSRRAGCYFAAEQMAAARKCTEPSSKLISGVRVLAAW